VKRESFHRWINSRTTCLNLVLVWEDMVAAHKNWLGETMNQVEAVRTLMMLVAWTAMEVRDADDLVQALWIWANNPLLPIELAARMENPDGPGSSLAERPLKSCLDDVDLILNSARSAMKDVTERQIARRGFAPTA